MPKTTPIFIMVDNRLLRETLSRILSKREDSSVVGAAPVSEDAFTQIEKSRASVVLFDSRESPEISLRAIRRISNLKSNPRVLMIGMEEEEEVFLSCVRAGATGYLLKDSTAQDILEAIRAIARGESVCPPSLCQALFRNLAKQATNPTPKQNVFISFAPKDREIARNLATKISDAGFHVWFSGQDLVPGDNISIETARALQGSHAMVVLLSPESVKSNDVLSEISFALGSRNYRGRIIPVMIAPTENVPWILLRFQIVHATDDLDRVSEEIVRALLRSEPSGEQLTDREQKIIQLLGEGLSNREVARTLGVTQHTITAHRRRILARIADGGRPLGLRLNREVEAES